MLPPCSRASLKLRTNVHRSAMECFVVSVCTSVWTRMMCLLQFVGAWGAEEFAWCVSLACYLTPFLPSDEACRPIQIQVHLGRPTLRAGGPFVPIYDAHSSPRLSRTSDCSQHLHLSMGAIVWGRGRGRWIRGRINLEVRGGERR